MDDTEAIHQLGDFIQRRAVGAWVRQWLELNEQQQRLAMASYCQQSSTGEIERMKAVLLQLAATYPSADVRHKLVRAYGLFMRCADEEGGTSGSSID